jgi:hypothetical protein
VTMSSADIVECAGLSIKPWLMDGDRSIGSSVYCGMQLNGTEYER